jgi:probable phosphoglycerate mutase
MTKIVLTRHGHVEGIKPERFRGRIELPLTECGKVQASTTARHIASIWRPAAVYTSPMSRSVETGRMIARACAAATEAINGLQDFDYVDWQWKSHDEVKRAWPDLYSAWFTVPHLVRIPNGESLQDLVARSADRLRLVLDRHPHDVIVLVGHDSVNRALLLQLLDQPLSAFWRLSQEPCALNEIDNESGRIRVHGINESGHLRSINQGV